MLSYASRVGAYISGVMYISLSTFNYKITYPLPVFDIKPNYPHNCFNPAINLAWYLINAAPQAARGHNGAETLITALFSQATHDLFTDLKSYHLFLITRFREILSQFAFAFATLISVCLRALWHLIDGWKALDAPTIPFTPSLLVLFFTALRSLCKLKVGWFARGMGIGTRCTACY